MPDQAPRCRCRPRLPAFDNSVAVDHQRLARVDRQQRRAGRAHRLDRRHADDRHIEAHVLIGLGHLDDPHAGARELAGARDDRVGAFHRFDRHDRGRLHRDGLSDVESGDRVRDTVPVGEVRTFLVGRRARGQHAFPGDQGLEKSGRVEQLDPVVAQHISDSGNDRIRVAGFEPHQHRHQRLIRNDLGEELGVLDLPRHDGFADAGLLQQRDAGPELAERDPMQRGRGRLRRVHRQFGKGFFGERDHGDVVTRAARGVEDEKRKAPVPRDQAEAHRRYSSASTSSARRVARRRITPRWDVRTKSTRYWTSSHESDRSCSMRRSALLVFSFDCSR